MGTNNAAFNESIVHARKAKNFAYRSLMGMINSAEWVVFMDDFVNYSEEDTVTRWTAITDDGATASAAVVHGGAIVIQSDGTAEGATLHLQPTVQLSGKRWFMEVRCRTEDADDTDLQFGLADLTAVTNPEDLWTTASADFLTFGVADGDATPVLTYDKNNGGPVTNTPAGTSFDLGDNTWHTLGLFYNGSASASTSGYLAAYVDGNLATVAGTLAQIPDDLPLAPFIGARTGGAAGHDIWFDYVRFAVER